ncbi:MAG TPA: BTAD domain-containing putative transcriptional regulator [Dehalococcoidia bacterium]
MREAGLNEATLDADRADPWAGVRALVGAGEFGRARELLRPLGGYSVPDAQALAVSALCEALSSFDDVTAQFEAEHLRTLEVRRTERRRLMAALVALLGGPPVAAPEPLLRGANVIPFRLGPEEVRLPFALRPPPRQLRVRFLGGFEIAVDGKTVGPWRNQRARLVLAYIFLHRRSPVTRQQLMSLFWPDHSEERAQNNLSLAVMAARRLLDESGNGGVVVSAPGSYRLDSEAEVWVDFEAFENANAAARGREAAGDDREAAALLDEAISLFAGDFMPDDLYLDWTADERRRLTDSFVDVLFRRARLARLADDRQLAVQLTRRILEYEPCSEEAHRQLMLDFKALGQRSRALRQMELCREALAAELGVEPEPETVRVFASL